MPKIIQLSPHIANLIAAGEVVERPASVIKELLENAVDAGASQITVEIREGGMTFMRVTDNGCGIAPEDAPTAFLRHATSKLRSAEDLAAISTMGFRGEALAAIASVSRIDLLTKTAGSVEGISLHLEGGTITEQSEAGCPDGTTIIVRDLFFNTPARMKFMKSDATESARIAAVVQQQALAHPEVAYRFLKDGKQTLSTPGNGDLSAAIYCVYGRECSKMVPVKSRWDVYSLTGFVSKPTDARPNRSLQTFFVNNRPVRSALLVSALEEAYRNQLMQGKYPACVLHLQVPANMVDVNVHPAKIEVNFLNRNGVFDCIHYGVLGALNKTPDRPQVQFKTAPAPSQPAVKPAEAPAKKQDFFRTMTPQEFKNFTSAVSQAPKPSPLAAAATAAAVERSAPAPLREPVAVPAMERQKTIPPIVVAVEAPKAPQEKPKAEPAATAPEPEQTALSMPAQAPWRMVGELYRSYILVELGEEAYLIDKHAAHERILFEKLKANQEAISSQSLLTPLPYRTSAEAAGILLANKQVLDSLGFELEEFGDNTLLVRQIPMDLSDGDVADALDTLASQLLAGRKEAPDTVRDNLLHTVACKAAIKAGWKTDDRELEALVKQVMEREDLKYCPHGRPICITLSKKQLEKQFKRS